MNNELFEKRLAVVRIIKVLTAIIIRTITTFDGVFIISSYLGFANDSIWVGLITCCILSTLYHLKDLQTDVMILEFGYMGVVILTIPSKIFMILTALCYVIAITNIGIYKIDIITMMESNLLIFIGWCFWQVYNIGECTKLAMNNAKYVSEEFDIKHMELGGKTILIRTRNPE